MSTEEISCEVREAIYFEAEMARLGAQLHMNAILVFFFIILNCYYDMISSVFLAQFSIHLKNGFYHLFFYSFDGYVYPILKLLVFLLKNCLLYLIRKV